MMTLLSQCINEVIHLFINQLLKLFLPIHLLLLFNALFNINYWIKSHTASLENYISCKLSCDVRSPLRQLESCSIGVETTFLSHKNLWLKRIFLALNCFSHISFGIYLFAWDCIWFCFHSHSQGQIIPQI